MKTLYSAAGQYIALHRQGIWIASLCLNILLYLIFSLIYPQSILEAGPSDGFYRLIESVLAKEEYELQFVHTIRFYIVYPLYILDIHEFYFIEGLVILVISLPIILFFRKGVGSVLVPLIIHSVFFISMRTYICACGFAYLFMIIKSHDRRNAILFFVSVAVSILSSGVLVVWAVVATIFQRRIRNQIGVVYFFGIAFAVMILSTSIMHKAVYFYELAVAPNEEFEQDAGEQGIQFLGMVKLGSKYILTIVNRNSLFQSIGDENYLKVLKYSVFISILLISTIHAFRSKDDIGFFFLPGLFAVLVEGLAFPSYYIAASLYVVTVVLPELLNAGKTNNEQFGQERRAIGLDQPRQGQFRS